MKKIFTLAIALIAFVGTTFAQDENADYYMQLNSTRGTQEYAIEDVGDIVYGVEDWKEYAVGTYTYNIYWCASDYSEVEKSGLRMYQSTYDPKRFKIANWAYDSNADVDFYFTWDQETGVILVDESDTGTQYIGWGEMYVIDTGKYIDGEISDAESYKDGDTFYFSLVYYTDGGYYAYTDGWWIDYERFEITSYSNPIGTIGTVADIMLVNHADGTYDPYYVDNVESLNFYSHKWETIGYAEYTDDTFTRYYGLEQVPYDVEIQECTTIPGLYRLVNPYGENFPYKDEFTYDDSVNHYLILNACDPDGVYFSKCDTGCSKDDGAIVIWSVADNEMMYGWTLEEMKEEGECGTLVDGVITFPKYSIYFSEANYNDGYLRLANSENHKIVLPSAR